jgi:DNA-binding FadR family transcriptional regulator
MHRAGERFLAKAFGGENHFRAACRLRAREAFEDHEKVFKAIATREPLAAMDAMQQHSTAVQHYYGKYIESQREHR